MKYMRDHCTCEKCFNMDTMQRLVDTCAIPSVFPNAKVEKDEDGVKVTWNDHVNGCSIGSFSKDWLYEHRGLVQDGCRQQGAGKRLWHGKELEITKVKYGDFMEMEQVERDAMRALYADGVVMVEDTPLLMEDTEKLARKIGFVLETIYGTMWTTSPEKDDQTYNDTASTNVELLHHTDCTYMREPPALQLFNCTMQCKDGGSSRFVDGFYVMRELEKQCPQALKFFTDTPISFQCFDNGTHLQTLETMVKVNDKGEFIQCRHNDYDRAPLKHLTSSQVEQFYEYQKLLVEIMRTSEHKVLLQPGQLIIVDNQRVLHGRYAFEGKRALVGCYIGRDEYDSRLRALNII